MDSAERYRQETASECRICGGTATGLHYGVITCEGCKVFYKRYMGKHQQYRCYFGGSCVIDLRTRSRCKACRYKKCIDQGMSVEAIRLGRTPKMFKTGGGTDCRPVRGSFGEPRPPPVSGMTSVIVRASSVSKSSSENDVVHSDRSSGYVGAPRYPSSLSHHRNTQPFHRRDSSSDSDSTLLRRVRLPQRDDKHQPTSFVSFSDENLNFMVSDFIGEFVRPCMVPDIKMPGSQSLQVAMEPSTLQKYWGVMRARNNVLECSIKAVSHGIETVFAEQIRVNQESVNLWHDHGLVPFQPQCTLEQMLMFVQGSVADFADLLFQFAVCLPGFTDLSQGDRATIVRDRWYVSWLITQASCYVDNECYHPIGPFRLHYCRYWMKQMLDVHFVRFVFSVTEDINELGLTLTETFLLLAVSFFRIDSEDAVEDKSYVDFLYSHYLDALIHLMGHGRSDVMPKLRAVIKRFSVVNEVHRRFVLGTSLEQAPLAGAWESSDMASVIQRNPDSFARSDFRAPDF